MRICVVSGNWASAVKSGQVLTLAANAGHPVSGSALGKLYRAWFNLSPEEKTKFADLAEAVKEMGLPKDEASIAGWVKDFGDKHPDSQQRLLQKAHEELKLFKDDKKRAETLVDSLSENPQVSLGVYEAVRAHKTLLKVQADKATQFA